MLKHSDLINQRDHKTLETSDKRRRKDCKTDLSTIRQTN